MPEYKRRYAGLRWSLVYGCYEGVEQFAVDELQRMVQRYLPYVLEVVPADGAALPQEHVILAGTAANNPWLKKLIEQRLLEIPASPESYALACLDSPWAKERRLLVIAGSDARGVLYGVTDFGARVLAAKIKPDDPTRERLREAFDGLEDFAEKEAPPIQNRGIWTWGYVIYDYRRFLDQMARLKMNMLTIWNDVPPLNARQVIARAHARGIKVIWGFPWGWGMEEIDLAKAEHRQRIKEEVVAHYRRHYHGLKPDGIYFQTLTEHHELEKDGQTIAALACKLVNETAAALFEENPGLYIQFGLHATSILDNYVQLSALDKRVSIVWEDAGVMPYAYNTLPYYIGTNAQNPVLVKKLGSAELTLEYSKALATFRQGTEFASVPKGWTALRWGVEFEHHGPFILGERAPAFIRRRLEERQALWDNRNTLWLIHYPHAARFYREILACRPARMTVTGLIEDGLFEEQLQLCVALFAEMIWNPARSDAELLERARNVYCRERDNS